MWGTVCDDSWRNVDAALVCRQLEYSIESQQQVHSLQLDVLLNTCKSCHTDTVTFSSAHFGAGRGPIHLYNCNGRESRLADCSRVSYTRHDRCRSHLEDVGVRCQSRFLASTIQKLVSSIHCELLTCS